MHGWIWRVSGCVCVSEGVGNQMIVATLNMCVWGSQGCGRFKAVRLSKTPWPWFCGLCEWVCVCVFRQADSLRCTIELWPGSWRLCRPDRLQNVAFDPCSHTHITCYHDACIMWPQATSPPAAAGLKLKFKSNLNVLALWWAKLGQHLHTHTIYSTCKIVCTHTKTHTHKPVIPNRQKNTVTIQGQASQAING